MQLCIYAHGIDLTEFTKRLTYQKLELALDHLESQVQAIRITLFDNNGPELGGFDKECHIDVQILNQEVIHIEDCDENVDTVIDRITDRLGVVACQRSLPKPRTNTGFRSWLIGESEDALRT